MKSKMKMEIHDAHSAPWEKKITELVLTMYVP